MTRTGMTIEPVQTGYEAGVDDPTLCDEVVAWARFVDPGPQASPEARHQAEDALIDAAAGDVGVLRRALLVGARELSTGVTNRSSLNLLRAAEARQTAA
jgi:hypothetical protein